LDKQKTTQGRKTLAVIQKDMTVKTIIYVIITMLFPVFLNSCDSNNGDTNNTPQTNKLTIPKDNFKQICDSSNILVLKLYKHDADSSYDKESPKLIWQDSILDEIKLNKFRALFKSAENEGYCCCARDHYTVTLYRNNKKLDMYQIDTSEIKDNITLFSNGYQASYVISLKDFNSFVRGK
jgi:hypothetical protein